MKIEKLEPSKHKEGRWLVWFDDGSLLRVGEGDVVRYGLYTGLELDEEAAGALVRAGEQTRMRERALELLSLRPMSRKELLDKLTAPVRRRRPGREPETEPDPEALAREREARRASAEAAADRLEELGLLNDREYARTVARHYAGKGYGARKLRDELYRRGVPRAYWDEALEGAEAESGGAPALDGLLRKKLKDAEPSRENLKKAADYLARRGFDWAEISEAVERYKAEYEE